MGDRRILGAPVEPEPHDEKKLEKRHEKCERSDLGDPFPLHEKQKHGSDVLAWQRWWNDHCNEYAGQPVRVNEDAVARTQEAYWKLFPFRKTRID